MSPSARLVSALLLAALALTVGPALVPAQDEKGYNNPYYPLQVGNKWTYQAGNQKVVVEVTKKEPLTRATTNASGKEVKERIVGYTLKITSGDKSLNEQVAILADGVSRFQAAGKAIEPPLRFFKLPLNKGDTWTVDSTSDGTPLKGNFKAGEDSIKVPAGQYQTMTVTSTDFQIGPNTMEIHYWFAPQVGMVKQQIKVGSLDTTLELLSFEQGK